MARRPILTATLAATLLLLTVLPVASAGDSRIRAVTHVGPDAGIMEVIPDTVRFSAADRSVSVAGTLECPAGASSLGVVVTVIQGGESDGARGESWDNVVQCGGRIGTVATSSGARAFGSGPATIRIAAFVCDLHCGTDIIDVAVILVPDALEARGRGKGKS
jgi:hypothetical protein